MPFDLHPEYPPEGIDAAELGQRYGFDLNAHHERLFGENGLPWTRHDRIPNSHAALNVAELARERGVHDEVHGRLMTGYWGEAVDISDPEALAELAAPAGLDHDDVVRAATEKPYEDRIGASTQAVYDMGGSGVPAFIVADKVLIPGAQPHELFDRVMERLEIEPQT